MLACEQRAEIFIPSVRSHNMLVFDRSGNCKEHCPPAKSESHSALQKIPHLLVIWGIITAFGRYRHWFPSWRIQSTYSHLISLCMILVIHHLRLGPPCGLLASGIPAKISHDFFNLTSACSVPPSFGQSKYKLWSSSLCNALKFLVFPVLSGVCSFSPKTSQTHHV
jgi:hypothetical protein